MTKTITVSDETYNLIKDQIEKDNKETKKAKLQIKTLAGEVLFESEKTTIKEAVVQAVSGGADLGDVDLEDADLGGADLRGADLRGADLRGAYLRDVDLEDADLGGADLRGTYLEDADLGGADLRGAYLEGADFYRTRFYGKGGTTKIKKNQVDDFLKALGVVVE